MAFLHTSPVSMMIPIKLKMLSVFPVTHSPPKAPIMARGRERSTIKG